jgi:hypothetical protein
LIAAQECRAALHDLKRLRLFGAFISKVQHNNLWDVLPGTLRLMQSLGIELRLFAAYRAQTLTGKLPKPDREAKVRLFLQFLERILSTAPYRRFWMLENSFRHEKTLWELSTDPGVSFSPDRADNDVAAEREVLGAMKWSAFQSLVPSFEGLFRIERFHCDPVRVVEKRRQFLNKHSCPRRAPQVLGYWRSRGDAPAVLRLEAHHAAILSRINGIRSVRTIITQVRSDGLRVANPIHFRSFFEEAVHARLVSLTENVQQV